MSTLSYLQSTLSYQQERMRTAEEALRLQKQRKNNIERIISNIQNKFDDYIGDMTKYAKNISEDIQTGVNGSRNMSSQSAAVKDEYEKYPESDSKLSLSLSYLNNELLVVSNKILELETEIGSLNYQIYNTQSEIQAENRRLEEEARVAQEAAAKEASKNTGRKK